MTATQPTLKSEIDWTGFPSAGYFDQLRYADNLIAYWRLNSGATFNDELAVLNGTVVGSPSTAAGALPNDSDLALTFNGTSQHAYVLDSAPLALPGSLSLQGWVKVASLPASTKDLVAKRGSFALQMDSAGKLKFTVKNDTTVTTVQSGAGVSTGSYYHVCCVHDAVLDTISLLVDGVLDASAVHTVGIEVTTQPLRFAASTSSSAPTYQSSQTASGTSTTATITAPASIASGDFLIAQITNFAVGTTVTPPTGWVLVGNLLGGTGDFITRIYYKIATGTEPANYTWTWSGSITWQGAISRITGVDALAPFANPVYSAAATSATSHSAGTHLPNLDNCMVLAFFSDRDGQTWTESSGTERYDTAGSAAVAMCSQTQTTAASIQVTGTSSGACPSTSFLVVLAGSGTVFTGCTLDDFTLWGIPLTAAQDVQHYQARLGGVGSWADSTNDIARVATRSGRLYEQDRINASNCDTTFDNTKDNAGDSDNRPYDPANPSSGNAPNVLPLRKLRHRAQVGASFYPIWRGFIERFPLTDEGDYESVAVRAVDAFEPLNLAGVTGTLASGLSGAQITKLLDKAGWPRADRAIDTGQFAMAETVLAADAKALPEIQAIAEGEDGIFFIDAAGVATYHDYAHRWTNTRSTTAQATFSTAADSNPTFLPPRRTTDKDRIINDWTVTTSDGTVRAASDALSIATFFRRSQVRSTRLRYPADAQTLATRLLQKNANPAHRFESLQLEPIDDATWAIVLNLAISDRITVIRAAPASSGAPTVTRDFFVEGIEWQISPDSVWSVTLQLSPCSTSTYNDVLLRYGPVSYWKFNTVT